MTYTDRVESWLENRFQRSSDGGIYHPHQALYGILGGYCDAGFLKRYITTYHIFNALNRIDFDTFLDVGGADGYSAGLVNDVFPGQAESCDLSAEACKRAEALFSVRATPVDGQRLPFDDEQYDVTLCSEVLEHIEDWEAALDEVLRVSKNASVITVPFESEEKIAANRRSGALHAHIHAYTLESFDFLQKRNKKWKVHKMPIMSPQSCAMLDQLEKLLQPYLPPHNQQMSATQMRVAEDSLRNLVRTVICGDSARVKESERYLGMRFIVVKNPKAFLPNNRLRLSVDKITGFRKEYLRLQN